MLHLLVPNIFIEALYLTIKIQNSLMLPFEFTLMAQTQVSVQDMRMVFLKVIF